MSKNTIIQVENLGKRFRIGHKAHPFRLRENLHHFFNPKKNRDEFWALKNINFEVKSGEILGIIGANGAGKSTLLKILSRITLPTLGKASIYGRVSSLLEVGTGFHPELTGRENIYLNGAILGMERSEIKKKFDEIVNFAEIGKFLDTPVKHYSSGMYVRLAFAVAAHLEPDILIVDEVLSVGDINFQKKCLGKIGEISQAGRTVLLVSHNTSSILNLSTRCLLLEKGKLVKDGTPEEVVRTYLKYDVKDLLERTDLKKSPHYGTGKARFKKIFTRVYDQKGKTLSLITTGSNMEFEAVIETYVEIKNTTAALIIYDEDENRLIDVNTLMKGTALNLKKSKETKIKFFLDNVRLKPGVYLVGLWLGILNNCDIDGIKFATSFRISQRREPFLGSANFPGVYMPEFKLRINNEEV